MTLFATKHRRRGAALHCLEYHRALCCCLATHYVPLQNFLLDHSSGVACSRHRFGPCVCILHSRIQGPFPSIRLQTPASSRPDSAFLAVLKLESCVRHALTVVAAHYKIADPRVKPP